MLQNQLIAADPKHSSWVAASAGSGKTKVLTDRVLRLLLQGALPHRILCLTYTKAAAAEMANRINAELLKWVKADDTNLHTELEKLLGVKPSAHQFRKARRLFAEVVDAPEGVRVVTIHSLCQSILRRFSIESGVSPFFRVLDDQETKTLIEKSRQLLFTSATATHSDPDYTELAAALRRITSKIAETTFDELLKEILSNRSFFQNILRPPHGEAKARQAILQASGFEGTALPAAEQLFAEHFTYRPEELARLRGAIPLLQQGAATDQKTATALISWLETPPSIDKLDDYSGWMLTSTREYRKDLLTNKIREKSSELEDWLRDEQRRCQQCMKRILAQETAEAAFDLLTLAGALLGLYQGQKHRQGLLDYDDLIATTARLLHTPGIAPWILYKLDGGIDHVLVDEAQDTSAIQWQLVESLVGEFFYGESARSTRRTLFVVGDEKQSIFSFQGAEPRAFAEMKTYFQQQIRTAEQVFEPVSLSLSFRSAQAVLDVVDAVFDTPDLKRAVLFSESEVKHQAYRKTAGRVELWPLETKEDSADAPEREPWTIPAASQSSHNPKRRAAQRIARTIRHWLDTGRPLTGKDRPVQPGDIMVLVKNRDSFCNFLMTELKALNIPVAGSDRLQLSDHIAIQDMLALAQFLLLPEDDLTLAALLKSPLIGLDEEQLFQLCHGREGSLWHALAAHADTQPAHSYGSIEFAHSWLAEMLNAVDYLSPFSLFARALDAEHGRYRFRERMGTEVDDPLNELLALALHYEKSYGASLQGFVHWFSKSSHEIKRDMEQSANQIRILTVHGSKGLQAPVVIFPQTTKLPDFVKQRLYAANDKTLFWAHNSQREAEVVTTAKRKERQEKMAEYYRLLYVALTRAEDECYITGWSNAKNGKAPEESWYQVIEQAMQRIGIAFSDSNQGAEWQGYFVTNDDRSTEEDRKKKPSSHAKIVIDTELPDWASSPPPEEPVPPRPLTPSRPTEALPAAERHLAASSAQSQAALRGTLTHRLLEILPDIAPEQRHNAATILLRHHSITAENPLFDTLWQEVSAILGHPIFAPVFGPGSLAEVPVTGTVMQDGQPRILSGQIDRLIVMPDRVLVLDYKTNRDIPASPAAIPLYYQRQLGSYCAAIAQLYPQHRIEAAILWTQGPQLMPFPLPLGYTA